MPSLEYIVLLLSILSVGRYALHHISNAICGSNLTLSPYSISNPFHVNKYTPHGFTGRGYHEIQKLFPTDIFDLNGYLSMHCNASVLDFGCGSGRALLQVYEKYPSTYTYCINKRGYRLSQSETYQDFVDVAYHFNITLHCNTTHFLLPDIYLTAGIETESFYPFDGKQFDLIYSIHALNIGKVTVSSSHIWMDKLIPLMKASSPHTGSTMILLLNDILFLNDILPSEGQGLNNYINMSYSHKLSKIKTWEYQNPSDSSYISITLFMVFIEDEQYKPYIAAIVRKCPMNCSTSANSSTLRSSSSSSSIPSMNQSSTHSIPEIPEFVELLRRYKTSRYGIGPLQPYQDYPDYMSFLRYSVLYAWNLIEQLDKRSNQHHHEDQRVAEKKKKTKKPMNVLTNQSSGLHQSTRLCSSNDIALLPYSNTSTFHVNGYRARYKREHRGYTFTGRSYEDLTNIFSMDVFDLDSYLSMHHLNASVLDYGCGSGRALLQIQDRFPLATTHCINRYEWGWAQSDSVQDFVDVAHHYKIPLHCNTTHYLLPELYLTSGIESDNNPPFRNGQQFDFIYSMNSLDVGKISMSSSYSWLHKLVPLLKTSINSVMILLLCEILYLDEILALSTQSYRQVTSKINTWEYMNPSDSSYVSMTLYIVFIEDEQYKPYIAAMVRKCPMKCSTSAISSSSSISSSSISTSSMNQTSIHRIPEIPDFIELLKRYKISRYGEAPLREEGRHNIVYFERYSVSYILNLMEHLNRIVII